MFRDRMLDRLEEMLDAAMKGELEEHDYDESRLSRLETKWKQFLGASQCSRQNLEQEKEKLHSLISDISHQTKTPIANMKLYAALLQENLEKSGQQEETLSLLHEISRQTDKLEFLMASLTKMSRLENNIVAVQPERQKILPLIDETVRNLSKKAEERDIAICRKFPDDSAITACFDWKWTREALENILDNGIKYSPCHSEIIIDARDYEMYAAITVRDHGIGIAEEEIPKIFERFYRSATVQQEDGVGIGLYLAREILRKENGYIKVNSKPGAGTEFSLYLWKGSPAFFQNC